MDRFSRLKGLATKATAVAGLGIVSGLLPVGSARAQTKTYTYGASSSRYVAWDFGVSGPDAYQHYIYAGSSTTTYDVSSISDGYLSRTQADAPFTSSWSSNFAYTDAYDGVLGFEVNGNNFSSPSAVIDLSNNQATHPVISDIDTGLDAQLTWFFAPDRPIARALFTVTNTGAATQSVTVTAYGDFGSDGSGGIIDTSSGDTTVDNTDYWAVSSDSTTDGGNNDPVLITSFAGPGASLTSLSVSLDTDSYNNDYVLDIAAGETRSLLVYHEMYVDITASAARSDDFGSGATLESSGLLAGLSSSERAQIANYSVSGSAPSPRSGAHAVPTMPVWLLGVMGGLLSLLSFRKLRKT